jgi:CRISPR-associated endonuclease/helicase Cas3
LEALLARPKELKGSGLLHHCSKVAEEAKKLASVAGLSTPSFYAGLVHDLGKLNPYYQRLFSADERDRDSLQSRLQEHYFRGHSILSALTAYWLLERIAITKKEREQALYAVASHHSHLLQLYKSLSHYEQSNGEYPTTFLQSYKGFLQNLPILRDEAQRYPKTQDLDWGNLDWDSCIRNMDCQQYFSPYSSTSQNHALEYLEFCIVFSSLLQADRGSFFEWQRSTFNIDLNTDALVQAGPLASLRKRFQEGVHSSNDFKDRIMVMEAPTGIGKTKIFLDLIARLTSSGNYESVFYFSPLLALTDDFENKLHDESFPNRSVIRKEDLRSILAYNHLYSGSLAKKYADKICDGEEETETDYPKTKDYFEIESFNWKFVITTTQRLLYILYSNSTSDKMKLLSFKNSLLILDEIQTLPKFLLPNLTNMLKTVAESLNSKILLVSATVPNQVKNAFQLMSYPTEVKEAYLKQTMKRISFRKCLDLKKEASTFRKDDRVLIMTNTRKKALTLYDSISRLGLAVEYISSGIRKRTRRERISNLRVGRPAIIISTQVMEAGVDVSFSKLYREIAPLDSVVQAMGRLNRELELRETPTMVVFTLDEDWLPYSELEYIESSKILREVKDSHELYRLLPEYYRTIDEKNASNRRLAGELEDKMKRLQFDEVWQFVWKNVLSEDSRGSVLIPDQEEWENVKQYYSTQGMKGKRDSYKRYADLMAEMPRTPEDLKITDLFDTDLYSRGILLPKSDSISKLYDPKTGLDGLLRLT